MEQPHHPAHVSLAPLPETLRLRHDDPRAETAPPRDVISPPRPPPRRRAPVLVVVLREMLAEERA